mmetsp:Transcript_29443/g.96096  ORF Transcript_29443/g.96096 Transcript_29443/m.96096 type:complete len:217 (+) Transcript_29443:950-1600(+)
MPTTPPPLLPEPLCTPMPPDLPWPTVPGTRAVAVDDLMAALPPPLLRTLGRQVCLARALALCRLVPARQWAAWLDLADGLYPPSPPPAAHWDLGAAVARSREAVALLVTWCQRRIRPQSIRDGLFPRLVSSGTALMDPQWREAFVAWAAALLASGALDNDTLSRPWLDRESRGVLLTLRKLLRAVLEVFAAGSPPLEACARHGLGTPAHPVCWARY